MPTIHNLRKKRDKANVMLANVLEPLEKLVKNHGASNEREANFEKILRKKPELDRRLEYFHSANRDMYDLLDTDDAEFNETMDREQDIASRCTDIAIFLSRHRAAEHIRTAQTANDSQNPPVAPAQPHMNNHHRSIQLPKLLIPTFYGNYLEWNQFYDNFRSAIDDNEQLSNIQKFTYLRSLLGGEAKRTIDGFATTEANYATAIRLLRERYGRSQLIINAHMKSLWNQPPPVYNPDSLRQFHDELETTIRELNVLGENENDFGKLLIPMLLGKLPAEFQRQLARSRDDDSWTLAELSQAMAKEIRVLSVGYDHLEQPPCDNNPPTVSAFYAETGTKINHCGSNCCSHSANPSVSAFYTKTAPGNTKREQSTSNDFSTNQGNSRKSRGRPKPIQRKCVYCDGIHNPTNCIKVFECKRRMEIVKRDRLCFNCLGKHSVGHCKSKFNCRVCQGRHHTSLHDDHRSEAKLHESSHSDSKLPHVNVHFTHASHNSKSKSSCPGNVKLPGSPSSRILLKTAQIPTSYRGKTALANVLFDEGADRSFVTARFAKTLESKMHHTEQLKLKSFNNSQADLKSIPSTTLRLHTRRGERLPIDVLCVDEISDNMENNVTAEIAKLPYLRSLPLASHISDASTINIDILIGADRYWDFIGDRIIRGPGPIAVNSAFGYLLSGPLRDGKPRSNQSRTFHITALPSTDDEMTRNIASYWDLESIGIRDVINAPQEKSTPDEQLRHYTSNCLTENNSRFTARLPWKPSHDPLPTNYSATRNRTKHMIKRLPRDIVYMYDKIISEQLKNNYIEQVANDNTADGHYLPHRAVSRDSATTPIRIVYDCSAIGEVGQPSLNDCLNTGPPLLNDLTAIMLRFRSNPTALTSDIEKAFLQIRLHNDDRKYTKFLWLADVNDDNSELVTYQFCSILFGATCSPFILNAAIKTLINNNIDVPAANDLQHNIYVDDVITGCHDTAEALRFYKDSTELLTTRGFNLRSWSSNDPKIREIIARDNKLKASTATGVLGMTWDTETDLLRFKQLDPPNIGSLTTKREVVSYSASLYDPIGLLSPVHVRAKLLIQHLWKIDHQWDTPITDELRPTWSAIANDLHEVSNINVKRRYFSDEDENQGLDIEIHAFADASDKAYGSSVYIKSGKQTVLVMAKTRVAPIKKQTLTLPRLELMAAVIATRLSKFVTSALSSKYNILRNVLWSDSQIALHWIYSRGKPDVFTTNRVKEITSFKQDCKYVPTASNPADLLTRGITPVELQNSSLWWEGPSWLKNRDSWPTCDLFDTDTAANANINHVCLTTLPAIEPALCPTTALVSGNDAKKPVICNTDQVGIQYAINIDNYNDYNRLLRVSAYVLRFVRRLKYREEGKQISPSATELNNAEMTWIANIQNERYADIFNSLRNNERKFGPLNNQLKLFIGEDKLLRAGGRLQNSCLEYDAKHPILMPGDHRLTQLMILDTHVRLNHCGPQCVITALRERIWITSIRRIVNRTLNKCNACKRVDGRAYNTPITAPLPNYRVNEVPPFNVSGVDYTGALYVRKSGSNGTSKAYVCLFTCAVTRAIHLELVPDLTTTSFMLAFRKFAARRSIPSTLISDNASTFVSAANELKEIMSDPEVQTTLARHRTTWKFIPKRSPWFGGFYERMIGITKTAIKKVLGKSCVTFTELQTLLTEVEASINDRPLTHVSSHIEDLTPLTPSQLVSGRNISNLPYIPPRDPVDYTVATHYNLNRRYEHLSSLLRAFWKRWSSEYLTALRERHVHTTSGVKYNTVKVGDIVLVHSDVDKRINWIMARITRLLPGADGIIRVAEIQTKRGKTNRSITKLYPLEISGIPDANALFTSPPEMTSRGDSPSGHDDTSTELSGGSSDNTTQSNDTRNTTLTSHREPRKAAVLARQRIKNNLNSYY